MFSVSNLHLFCFSIKAIYFSSLLHFIVAMDLIYFLRVRRIFVRAVCRSVGVYHYTASYSPVGVRLRVHNSTDLNHKFLKAEGLNIAFNFIPQKMRGYLLKIAFNFIPLRWKRLFICIVCFYPAKKAVILPV